MPEADDSIQILSHETITLCHQCDLLQRSPPLPVGGASRCRRCGQPLHRHRPDSLGRTLALTLTGLILFGIANAFPFLSFEMQGQASEVTLFSAVMDLYGQGQWAVASVVLFTSILAPGIQLLLLLVVLLALRRDRLPRGLPSLFRWLQTLTPWGMLDVLMIATLVAVVKLSGMADILIGTALFALAALIFVLAAAQAALDPDLVWERIPIDPASGLPSHANKRPLGCPVCELVVPEGDALQDGQRLRCPRCAGVLHARKPQSLQRTWALVITALVLYVPANTFPIMSVTSLGQTQSDTILSGVIYLIRHDMWPLALIVFIASVFVPLLKLLVLVYLMLSVHWRSTWRPRDRTRLYRATEAIGRWSMVDIYVVTLLVALVRLGNLASVEAEPGALFFCAVVIFTMLAATTFEPRLIWDAMESPHARQS